MRLKISIPNSNKCQFVYLKQRFSKLVVVIVVTEQEEILSSRPHREDARHKSCAERFCKGKKTLEEISHGLHKSLKSIAEQIGNALRNLARPEKTSEDIGDGSQDFNEQGRAVINKGRDVGNNLGQKDGRLAWLK